MAGPRLFKFLDCEEHVASWIDGGLIRISPASTYLAADYSGIETPDEVIQRSVSGLPGRIFDMRDSSPKLISVHPEAAAYGERTSITIVDCYDVDGSKIDGVVEHFRENSLVLCLSYANTRSVAKRLKKRTIVRIRNLAILKNALDSQMRLVSESGKMLYTSSPDRNHFLKGIEEESIREHRLVWHAPLNEVLWLKIPKGVACRTEMQP